MQIEKDRKTKGKTNAGWIVTAEKVRKNKTDLQ